MVGNSSSVRIGENFKTFLKNLRKNRIKADTDDDIITSVQAADLIVRYFKEHNDEYLELVQMEEKNA